MVVGSLHIEERSALGAEDDVLRDREAVHQHEVLVDHADAERDRVAGRVDPYLLTADGDPALIRRVQAVQDPHQGRLPGAVLADQGVHLTLQEGEVHVIVRDDARETLRDPGQHDERGACAPRFAVIVPGLCAHVPAGPYGSVGTLTWPPTILSRAVSIAALISSVSRLGSPEPYATPSSAIVRTIPPGLNVPSPADLMTL